LFAVIFPFKSQAATRTWDGGGITNNWSECANWSSDACPGTADIALFNGTSTKNAVVDVAFGGQVLGVNIASGYTGTVSLQRDLIVTTSDFIQASGTFDMGNFSLTISGSSADFRKTGGTFNEGTGTLVFTG